ncbi:CcdB family protein [Wenxinia saemankumensis]|uniref:CcdB family protein n=1 Tax=Wenxinia saemankumensis TaxID=1447782 RepID=UPI001FCDC628|nr:CcdB family protein [Wenxinia saemankumensis]
MRSRARACRSQPIAAFSSGSGYRRKTVSARKRVAGCGPADPPDRHHRSRVVAPLRDDGRYPAFPGLTPANEISGTMWIARVQELAAVPETELRRRVESLSENRDTLKRALDILINGV